MNYKLKYYLTVVSVMPCSAFYADTQHTEKNIDFDWYFHLGDMQPGKNIIDFSEWKIMDIPHNWNIEECVKIESEFDNLGTSMVKTQLTSVIEDVNGKEVTRTTKNMDLKPGVNCNETILEVTSPSLWSVDSPTVYHVYHPTTQAWTTDKYHDITGFVLSSNSHKIECC